MQNQIKNLLFYGVVACETENEDWVVRALELVNDE
jgi:hypothetical protein